MKYNKAEQFELEGMPPMNTNLKRTPTFEDTDKIWFGRHQGEPLSDVPAHYFRWLWHDADYKTYSGVEFNLNSQPPTALYNKVKLANYIWNSQSAIAQELGEEFP